MKQPLQVLLSLKHSVVDLQRDDKIYRGHVDAMLTAYHTVHMKYLKKI